MSIQAKLIALILLIVGVFGYGHWQNKKGYRQAQLEAKAAVADLEIKYRAQEQLAQKKADNNYAEYEAQKLVTQKSSDSLTTAANSLRGQLTVYKRRLSETADNPAGTIATGEAGFDILGECTDRYSSMAKEAGRLADKVNGLIGQIQK
jgi:hypothetical protein